MTKPWHLGQNKKEGEQTNFQFYKRFCRIRFPFGPVIRARIVFLSSLKLHMAWIGYIHGFIQY